MAGVAGRPKVRPPPPGGWGGGLGGGGRSQMTAYLGRRSVEAAATVLVASLLVFAMVAALPGDPAQVILGDRGTPEQLAALRAYLGLDRSIPAQYLRWLTRLAGGDLGYSMLSGIPVADTIRRTLPVTLQLAAWALGIVVLIALPRRVHGGAPPRPLL